MTECQLFHFHDKGSDVNCFIFKIKELMPVTECQLFQFIMIKELMPHDRVPTALFYHDKGTDAT